MDKTGKPLFSNTIIPNRGAWLEYETDSNDVVYVRIDRTRKIPVTVLLRALGLGTNPNLIEMFGDNELILSTIDKDVSKSKDEGLVEIYKRLRPGEPPTVESAEALLNSLFFDPRRYDLAKVGRYKFNKKCDFRKNIRLNACGRCCFTRRRNIGIRRRKDNAEKAVQIEENDVNRVVVDVDGKQVIVFSNKMVNLSNYVDFDPQSLK